MMTGFIKTPLTQMTGVFGCSGPVCCTEAGVSRSTGLQAMYASLVIVLLLLQSGCGTIRTLDGDLVLSGGEKFRAYAANVFQRQNATLVSLFDVFEFAADENLPDLDRVEQLMLDSCAALNDAAAAHRDGKLPDAGILKQVASTIVACDAATREAEQVIQRVRALEQSPVLPAEPLQPEAI